MLNEHVLYPVDDRTRLSGDDRLVENMLQRFLYRIARLIRWPTCGLSPAEGPGHPARYRTGSPHYLTVCTACMRSNPMLPWNRAATFDILRLCAANLLSRNLDRIGCLCLYPRIHGRFWN